MFKVFLSSFLVSVAVMPAFAQDISATIDMSAINVPQVVESAPPPPPPPPPAYVARQEQAPAQVSAPEPQVYAERAAPEPTQEVATYASRPPTRLESVGVAAPIDQPDVSRERGDRGERRDGGGDRDGDRRGRDSGSGGGGWATTQAAPPPAAPQPQNDGGGRGGWDGGNRRNEHGGGWRRQEEGAPRGREDNDWSRGRPQPPVVQGPSTWPQRGDNGNGSWGGGRGGNGGGWATPVPQSPRPDRGGRGDAWGGRDEHRDRDRDNRWGRDRHDDHGRGRDWDRGNRGWENHGWNNNYGWNNGGSYRDWNRGWRNNNRYNWEGYRYQNRGLYRSQRYVHPYGYNYSYRRFSIGFYLDDLFFSSRYWLTDPWQYRLPDVYGPYRWVRYYDDVLLVDVRNGRVVDVVYDFFW
jgi:Nickel/cobalt transporter regulator